MSDCGDCSGVWDPLALAKAAGTPVMQPLNSWRKWWRAHREGLAISFSGFGGSLQSSSPVVLSGGVQVSDGATVVAKSMSGSSNRNVSCAVEYMSPWLPSSGAGSECSRWSSRSWRLQ